MITVRNIIPQKVVRTLDSCFVAQELSEVQNIYGSIWKESAVMNSCCCFANLTLHEMLKCLLHVQKGFLLVILREAIQTEYSNFELFV